MSAAGAPLDPVGLDGAGGACHCITCSDEGVAMFVSDVDAGRGVALCVDERGVKHTVEAALVGPLELGDAVLVHAGVALVALPAGTP